MNTLHSDMKSLNCVSSAAIFAYSSRRDALVAALHPLPSSPGGISRPRPPVGLHWRKPQRRRHWLSGRPNSEGIPPPSAVETDAGHGTSEYGHQNSEICIMNLLEKTQRA